MQNELTVINEQEVLGKEFRIYGTFENPLFLAKDVAEWIDYDKSKLGQMLKNVDEDEKGHFNVSTLGGVQKTWFLTEDGLYEVLMQSRKPIAKKFKKEVKNILKEIRTTGTYTVQPPKKTQEELVKENLFLLVYGNSTPEERLGAVQVISDHSKAMGKFEICDNNATTIPQIKTYVMKHYGDILYDYNVFLTDGFIEFNRFLAYKHYLVGKRFRAKGCMRLEKRASYQPTQLFEDTFVKQGMALVRVIDERGKVEITYTKDIEKYILTDSFKYDFFTYLGINLEEQQLLA